MSRCLAPSAVSVSTVLMLGTASLSAQSSNHLDIARAGESALTATVNRVGVNVAFRSAEIHPGDPLHPLWESLQSHTFVALVDIRTSVGGRAVIVPHAVFADLLDATEAVVRAEKGFQVLRITGGDASESYMADVLFDRHRVIRRRVYSLEGKRTLTSDTRYFYSTD